MANEAVLALLERAGMVKAKAAVVEQLAKLKKLQRAYQVHEWVRQESIDAFNLRLMEETAKSAGTAGRDLVERFKQLCFTPLEDYADVPPVEALEAIAVAKESGVFDAFEVAQIKDVEVYKDPIVFGRINGCTDRFFVCQWDTDVSFEDLAKAA